MYGIYQYKCGGDKKCFAKKKCKYALFYSRHLSVKYKAGKEKCKNGSTFTDMEQGDENIIQHTLTDKVSYCP